MRLGIGVANKGDDDLVCELWWEGWMGKMLERELGRSKSGKGAEKYGIDAAQTAHLELFVIHVP